eukprot:GGOE01059247.1.p1 GENE.GGOE01059247.1~~GGOE01059247.1.p1  ORF type:complete len:440 (-),score=124.77 GGOE01059247.1:234-1526(-)
MDTPPYHGGLNRPEAAPGPSELVAASAGGSAGPRRTHEELQQQLQQELERELEEQFASHQRPAAKQEIRLGAEAPLRQSPSTPWPEAPPSATAKVPELQKTIAPPRTLSVTEVRPRPELSARRVAVDDPSVPQPAVIAQLKADLAEAQARKEAGQSVMVALARKEAQVLDLKRRLVALTTPKRDTGSHGAYSPLITDPLLIATFRRQAREIQRLREELDRERSQNAVRPNELPSHTALRLISKLQLLQKENAQLSQALEGNTIGNKWALLSILKHEADEFKAALNGVVAQGHRAFQELREAQAHQQKMELALQKLLKTEKVVKEESKEPPKPFVFHPIEPPAPLPARPSASPGLPTPGYAAHPAGRDVEKDRQRERERERERERRDEEDRRRDRKEQRRSPSPRHRRAYSTTEGRHHEDADRDRKRHHRE